MKTQIKTVVIGSLIVTGLVVGGADAPVEYAPWVNLSAIPLWGLAMAIELIFPDTNTNNNEGE